MTQLVNTAQTYTPLWKLKSANEGVTNSSAYQDDDDIAGIAYTANQKYFYLAHLYCGVGSATSGMKCQLVASNATMTWQNTTMFMTGGVLVTQATQSTAASRALNANIIDVAQGVICFGYCMDTSAGTLKLQFAQWNAEANTSTMMAKSHLLLLPVS